MQLRLSTLGKALAFVILTLIHAPGIAQPLGLCWVKTLQPTNISYGLNLRAVATDKTGDIYTLGEFRYTMDFDPGPGQAMLTADSFDIVLSKIDSGGNFQWARRIGGPTRDLAADVTVTPTGELLVTGQFTNQVDFDPGPGTAILNGGTDDNPYLHAFLAKFDGGGNLVWVKEIGDSVHLCRVTYDSSGNIYLTGGTYGNCDLDPGPGVYIPANPTMDYYSFLLKLNGAGVFQWAVTTTAHTDYDKWMLPSVALNGDVYVTGTYVGGMQVGPFFLSASNPLNRDIFFFKVGSNGTVKWAKTIGGSSLDLGYSIAALPSGDGCYAAGIFRDLVDFDPGPGVHNENGPQGDNYLLRLDSAGNFRWVRTWGNNAPNESYEVVLDHFGNVYTTGLYWDTLDLDPGPGVYDVVAPNPWDRFDYVCKLDSAGNFILGWSTGFTGGNNFASDAITLDRWNNIITVGTFSGTADFDPGPNVLSLTSTWYDGFISKVYQDYCPGFAANASSTPDAGSCNGTATAVAQNGTPPFQFSWSNGGQVASLTGLCAGWYQVTITDAFGCSRKDSVFVPGPNSIKDISANAFSIYPNPATGSITVNFADGGLLELRDLTSRIVLQKGLVADAKRSKTAVDISMLPAGVYIYSFKSQDTEQSGKLVVMH